MQKTQSFAAQFCTPATAVNKDKDVKAIEDDNMEEVFPTGVAKVGVDDSQLVTVQMESGCYLRFQVDTGAQCNVLPLKLYKNATKDYNLARMTPVKSHITAYGGATLPVLGTVTIPVCHGDQQYRLHCKLVNNPSIRPLIERRPYLQTKLMSYLNNDELNRPNTGNLPVYALEMKMASNKDLVLRQYPKVFGSGIGGLQGKYHIQVDELLPSTARTYVGGF